MMRKLLITLATWFTVFGFALGGTIDPNTPDSKYVEYGKDFHCIGKFCGIDKKGQLGIGACVAIKSRIVLTAAHVVHDVVSSHVDINGREIRVLKMESAPGFVHAGKFGNDIAVCFLKDDIGLNFYPELYEKNDELRRIVSISGFGLQGTFHTGGVKDDMKRRAGSNIIDNIDGDLLMVSPSRNERTELEFCITPGDSGGGMFLDNKVAGINSAVLHSKGHSGPLGKYGHDSTHTRVSHHREWILETIKLHESGFHGNQFMAEKPEAKDINSVYGSSSVDNK